MKKLNIARDSEGNESYGVDWGYLNEFADRNAINLAEKAHKNGRIL